MRTLQDTLTHFSRVFGQRNRMYLPSSVDRTFALLAAVDNVQDGVRKGAPKYQLAVALAHVAARTFACVEAYGDIRFVKTLAAKYPVTKCIFCHKRPCECSERRKRKHALVAPNSIQCRWSLKQWCDSFRATYGDKNKRRGKYYCLARLFGEVAEFAVLQMPSETKRCSRKVLQHKVTLELADVFAWTIAMANVLDVRLDQALSRYDGGCDVCKKKVCACAHYDMRRTVWQTLKRKK